MDYQQSKDVAVESSASGMIKLGILPILLPGLGKGFWNKLALSSSPPSSKITSMDGIDAWSCLKAIHSPLI
jgi:hypothetical protein